MERRVDPGAEVSDDAVFLRAVDGFGIRVAWPRLRGRPIYIEDGQHWVRVELREVLRGELPTT